jgi:hypothetical protein
MGVRVGASMGLAVEVAGMVLVDAAFRAVGLFAGAPLPHDPRISTATVNARIVFPDDIVSSMDSPQGYFLIQNFHGKDLISG